MNQLTKQIREVFFNPVLYFLPTLIFLIGNEFRDVDYAVRISFPTALFLVFYIYYVYKRVFFWHGVFATFYLFVAFVSSLFNESFPYQEFIVKIIFISFLLVLILSKNLLSRIASKTVRYNLPMSNNESELIKVSKILLVITVVYIFISIITNAFIDKLPNYSIFLVKNLYALALVAFSVSYSVFIVKVRKKLKNEDWLPIVNEQGSVIGSVQYQPGVQNDAKLMHPVIRFYFVENNRILLQQRWPEDRNEALRWDASVSHKVRMSESLETVLTDQLAKQYKKKPELISFLTNYIYEGSFCKNYIYLFVSCQCDEIHPQKDEVYASKWWTVSQIEEELGSGIFSERFELEYPMIIRTGLLQGRFECDDEECLLRKAVYGNIDG